MPSRDAARRRAARTRGGSRTYHVLALEELLRDDRREAAEEVTAAIDDNHLLGTRRDESAAFSVSGTARKERCERRARGRGRMKRPDARGGRLDARRAKPARARHGARVGAPSRPSSATRAPGAGSRSAGVSSLERWRWDVRQGFGREIGASCVRDAC